MTTHLHTRYRQSDVEASTIFFFQQASTTWVNAVHTYSWHKIVLIHMLGLVLMLSTIVRDVQRQRCWKRGGGDGQRLTFSSMTTARLSDLSMPLKGEVRRSPEQSARQPIARSRKFVRRASAYSRRALGCEKVMVSCFLPKGLQVLRHSAETGVATGKIGSKQWSCQRGGEMPVNTLYASFFQRFNQLLLIQQPMRNDHSIAGTTILQTTLEDADNTQ